MQLSFKADNVQKEMDDELKWALVKMCLVCLCLHVWKIAQKEKSDYKPYE